jgi:hypothetical protein
MVNTPYIGVSVNDLIVPHKTNVCANFYKSLCFVIWRVRYAWPGITCSGLARSKLPHSDGRLFHLHLSLLFCSQHHSNDKNNTALLVTSIFISNSLGTDYTSIE